MTEPLILKKNEKPSFFNKEMAIGALLGLNLANPSLLVMGTALGAFIGENRMAREKEYGKIIDIRTSSSKDTLLGAILGSHIGTGIVMLALRTADIPNLPLNQKAIFAAAGLTGMVIGGYTGNKHGINAYEKEYAEAISQQQESEVGKSQVKAVEVEHGNFYSGTPVKNYASAILEQREKPFNPDRQV